MAATLVCHKAMILYDKILKRSFWAVLAACYRSDVWPKIQSTHVVFKEKSVA